MDDIAKARDLRKNQTEAEQTLWNALRDRRLNGAKFRRQHPYPPYTLDFFCEELNLAIELDGGQHNELQNQERDHDRTDFLNRAGIRVIRFWNNDVLANTDGVLQVIAQHIPSPDPRLSLGSPSPAGRGSDGAAGRGDGKTKRVLIGEIATAHGIKGLVQVRSFAGDADLFSRPLYAAETGDEKIPLSLKSRKGEAWLAAVEGVADRTAAEKLRGTKLYIDRADLPGLAAGQYYHADLIGLKAVDENGKNLGTVAAISNFGASDLLEIEPTGGGESFYLPFTQDNIRAVAGETITVRIPEGLIE